MWKALLLPLAGFAISLLAVPDSRGQTPVIETIALAGDPIPNGERFIRGHDSPSIDADGGVVFRVYPSAFNPSGLILKSTGRGTTLTQIPDIPPGFSTNDMGIPFSFFLPSGPIVNAGGTVAFTSLVTAGFTPAVDILFTGTELNGLNAVARSDELLDVLQPNAADETLSLQIGEFVLNESGAAAFVVDLFHRLGRDPGALFVPGESGGFVPIVRSGGQAPDTEPGTVFIFFERLVMNTEGDVAFQASLENPAEGIGAEFGSDNFSGIWRIRNGQVHLVARRGDLAPGFDGEPFTGFFDMAISPSGEVVFQGRLGRSFVPAGLWSGTNPADLEGVVVGRPTPTNLGFDQRFGGPTQFAFTKAGDLIFSAPGSPVESGIWKVVGERVESIVHGEGFLDDRSFFPGDIVPETGETFFGIGDFVANGDGRIAFEAQFRSGL